jgi:hypothetical protein
MLAERSWTEAGQFSDPGATIYVIESAAGDGAVDVLDQAA